MTDRLYYHDAYALECSATVRSVDVATNGVVLDRTCFYPTSGGQPHDVGTLAVADDGDAADSLDVIAVRDVIDAGDDIVHVVDAIDRMQVGQHVHATVDRTRRFDFMQQHTGQHLLSALCADVQGWKTLSVHFGDGHCTVDVDAPAIGAALLREMEQQANARITENRAVTVSFEDAESATGLRKASERGGQLRIVTIDDIDRSACGGTHVRRTGEIGVMLLRGAERSKGGTRITFLCGQRAVARASMDAELLQRTARELSALPDETPTLVASLAARLRESERERKRIALALAGHEALSHWQQALPGEDGVRRITIDVGAAPVRDSEPLVQAIVALGRCTVLACGGNPPGVMFAVADDVGQNAGALLKPVLANAGGRGGGSARLAQGSVPDASALDALRTALGH